MYNNHVNDTIYMSASSTETNFTIHLLTSYVNYTNGSSIFTITITRCTYV